MIRWPLILGAGAILMGAWTSQLGGVGGGSFATHRTAHMAVVVLAAPLMAAAMAGSSLDPVRRYPTMFNAISASVAELVVVWVWHTPVLHLAARHSVPALVLEQGSFLAAGLWLWLSILGGDVNARIERAAMGVLALVLTFAHMTLLGALLALTPRPLYHHAAASSALATADQQLGGVVMLAFGTVTYVGAGVWLAMGLLRRDTVHHA